ncbi:MAG: hypothetical protein ACO31E_10855, partial [Phycisphaerales bacterium]
MTTLQGRMLWRQMPAGSQPVDCGGAPLVARCEWIRIMVGRCLSLTQCDGGRWFYLVTGTPLDQLDPSQDAHTFERLRSEIELDIDLIATAVAAHRSRILDGQSLKKCLGGYVLLRSLRVPPEPAKWHLTDEGVFVVDWGLKIGKP